jgi:hypothetical protein
MTVGGSWSGLHRYGRDNFADVGPKHGHRRFNIQECMVRLSDGSSCVVDYKGITQVTLRDRMDQPGSDLVVALPILRVTDC